MACISSSHEHRDGRRCTSAVQSERSIAGSAGRGSRWARGRSARSGGGAVGARRAQRRGRGASRRAPIDARSAHAPRSRTRAACPTSGGRYVTPRHPPNCCTRGRPGVT
ncbi:unnamed protein product [Chrysodeixis includens]|uniref:Uncharacterized protein n=1 Tax=Chrysodeixis includens TaxID=689277 RepID=A0A9N8Q0E4_CHRIL|nr:unnamed protein product [Chrysodeixis includens]